jgi:hypothetical protein
MRPSARFLLDANVFIEAHRRYYAFDIWPGYWDALIVHHGSGRLSSIDRVRDELLAQTEALARWAQQLPGSFFEATGDPSVTRWFGRLVGWVQAQPRFFLLAKQAFAAGADGWLIAYAKAHGFVIGLTRRRTRTSNDGCQSPMCARPLESTTPTRSACCAPSARASIEESENLHPTARPHSPAIATAIR